MVHGEVGSRLKVIFGGGRQEFRDETMVDEDGHPGRRTDKRDLIQEWLDSNATNDKRTYIWNKVHGILMMTTNINLSLL